MTIRLINVYYLFRAYSISVQAFICRLYYCYCWILLFCNTCALVAIVSTWRQFSAPQIEQSRVKTETWSVHIRNPVAPRAQSARRCSLLEAAANQPDLEQNRKKVRIPKGNRRPRRSLASKSCVPCGIQPSPSARTDAVIVRRSLAFEDDALCGYWLRYARIMIASQRNGAEESRTTSTRFSILLLVHYICLCCNIL